MAGSGTGPLPRDIARLTPVERKVYLWACETWSRKIYPSARLASDHFGYSSYSWMTAVIRRIRRKVGYPCPIANRPSGTYGLTQRQRDILTMAWDLWDRKPRENPTLRTLLRVLGNNVSYTQLVQTRRICLEKKIWPCEVQKPLSPYPPALIDMICNESKIGTTYEEISKKVLLRFNRVIYKNDIYRIRKKNNLSFPSGSFRRESIEDRKARVIADRNGLAPAKLTDPAAYRRAVRAARRPPASAGG